MQPLVSILIFALVFAILAYALYWVCTRFFPGFPPALWICGVLLIILLLMAFSQYGGMLTFPRWGR